MQAEGRERRSEGKSVKRGIGVFHTVKNVSLVTLMRTALAQVRKSRNEDKTVQQKGQITAIVFKT